jgi:subtilisin-like proprotein convertase family protein
MNKLARLSLRHQPDGGPVSSPGRCGYWRRQSSSRAPLLALLCGLLALSLAISPQRAGAQPGCSSTVGGCDPDTHAVNDKADIFFPLTISGVTNPISTVTVSLFMDHPRIGQLTFQLISPGPNYTTVTLANQRGGNNANMGLDTPCDDGDDTIFSDGASTPISAGTAPFLGTFKPETPLSAFNGKTGSDANGTWFLRITDNVNGQGGQIRCWCLNVTSSSPDTDNDGVLDCVDNCVTTPNPSQTDSDNDGRGDACDNCPNNANPGQQDSDNDGRGDACDNCPNNANPGQEDTDNDGTGDACDGCPNDPNKTAPGFCGCGFSEADSDNDGTPDCADG